MGELIRAIAARSHLALIIIAAVCASLLAATNRLTHQRIDANHHHHEMKQLTDLAGTPLPTSTSWVGDIWNLCNGTTLARGQASGYGGSVAMLLAITVAEEAVPTLNGIRITHHQETPGLADFLQHPNRGWLASLHDMDADQIVRVDAVTGATISGKAVLTGVLAGFEAAANGAAECPP